MRLSKIRLAGFKSFVDPTTVQLPTNLTGVVGPNGCGKSNVIDAVRARMSIRQFTSAPIEDQVLRDLVLDSARAPSGGNVPSTSDCASL